MTLLAAAPAAVRELHEGVAWFLVVSNGLVGAWALLAHWQPAWRRKELWWATAVAEVAIFVEVVLGVTMAPGVDNVHLRMHMFYGFIAAFSVAIIYSYRSQIAPHRYLLYGFGGLFLMGLGLRAIYLNPI